MSDFEALDDIYETSQHPAGSPCHPHQAKARRKYMLEFKSRQIASRAFNPGKHKPPVVSLAKINLPD